MPTESELPHSSPDEVGDLGNRSSGTTTSNFLRCIWTGCKHPHLTLTLHSIDRTILSVLKERANSFCPGERYRLKLLLNAEGAVTVTASALRSDCVTGSVRVSAERTSSEDVYLRHKTTSRHRYDRLYQQARDDGFDEVLFLNERDEVTEGAISNIFIRLDAKLFTPPLSSGVLPGVFRHHILNTCGNAEERTIFLKDLESADSVFLCNSVRGMRSVSFLSFSSPLHKGMLGRRIGRDRLEKRDDCASESLGTQL